MSELHIRQIRSALERRYGDIIDLSDLTSSHNDDVNNQLLSRSLAAFSLVYLAQVSDDVAASSITDGYGDNGIDAVYYHPADRTLYLVQSKWSNDGSKTISRGEIQKFIKGFKDFINARWDRFNDHVKERSGDLEIALNDAQT
ncbi:MAG: hypothetical protein MI923_21935, partial [Phycisphaerales bacterium]|nr:hypothetical protein [Phycisphaerales bacterium]